ncbi:MAG: Gfo/Idh/MocA family oxidoreductase [Candidatus Hydrogenedentes bacterium]|nr:Gfo/Idh/MocA family oxidoreductase [Candidatus Hydrogenedentota bacterium]
MNVTNRRTFLKASGAGLIAGAVFPGVSSVAKAAPSERVRHGIIGVGGQGRHHAKQFSSFADCEVVAISDVDPAQIQDAKSKVPDIAGATVHADFRALLEDPTIDSVSVVTPDHWHAPVSLAALLAGKHVYVEKPCAHNIHEAMALKTAAAKSGKCVQQGTQGRSGESLRQAVTLLRDGIIGKVRMAKAINHQLREPIGREPETDPPAGVNYDMWLGPAPVRPFTRNRWHYQWHWFWDYGCGDMGNDGIHQIDQARWGLGVGIPKAVSATGGQLFYQDDHETPDTQVVTFEYDNCYLLYEMRLWTDYKLEGHDNGVVFYGDKGTLEFGRGGCDVSLIGEEKKHLGPYADIRDHMRNFLDCVKSNNPAGLNGGIEEGAISTSLCHLGNIATRVGRRLRVDPVSWQCVDDADAAALYKREYRKGYELPIL